jgi:uncharacterized protein
MMIDRRINGVIEDRLAHYPAVALVGARQAGKTTLAQSLGGAYFDLEQEPQRLNLDLRWDELAAGKDLVILDEAQAWPEVFPRLRGAIDAARSRKGRFLLLGSVSPAIMVHVSESLAGRLALVELTPFLISELPDAPVRRLWCRGGYPEGGVVAGRFPQWQRDYLALLAQRDLPAWGLPGAPQVTARLLKMLAAVHGQLWNASEIGKSMGLSYHTVNQYMDYLDGAFMIRRLAPYQANLRKRLVKSPKVYWRDTGLLHSLLNIAGEEDLLAHPRVGASWEGFVIEQIIGILRQLDRTAEAYFFRTSDKTEIDLVLDFGSRLWAVEAKLTASPAPADMASLNKAADLLKADRRILVSQTVECVAGKREISCNIRWLADHMAEL